MRRFPLLLCAFPCVLGSAAYGATVWSAGPNDLYFTLPAGATVSLPQNQDRIAADTWITRDTSHGIYNIFSETAYVRFVSPANTQWAFSGINGNPAFAYGAGAAGYPGLTFASWETALGSTSSLQANILNRPGVVHLVSEDLYVDVIFTSWGGIGGGFAYTHAMAPPTAAAWDGAVGNWSDATHWSTNPAYPSNGGGVFYNATIGGGVPTLDVSTTVSGLSLAGAAGAWTSGVDLGANALVVQDGGPGRADTLARLQDQVAYGSGHPAGIISSTTAADPSHKVTQVVDNALLGFTQFAGQPVDAHSLLVESTWKGDANLDRKVDVIDLGVLATNYGTAVTGGITKGDFNGDGKVDVIDLGILATDYGLGTGGGGFALQQFPGFAGTAAPEPMSIAFLAASLPLLRRRRRC